MQVVRCQRSLRDQAEAAVAPDTLDEETNLHSAAGDKHFAGEPSKPAEDALVRLRTPRPHFLSPLNHQLPHMAEWPLRRAPLIGPRRSGGARGRRQLSQFIPAALLS